MKNNTMILHDKNGKEMPVAVRSACSGIINL